MKNKIELIQYRSELQQELNQAELDYNNEKTSHIVHLAVSVFTGGLWVIGWMIASHSTTKRKQKLMLDIKEIRKEIVDVEVAIAKQLQNNDIPQFLYQ